LYYFVIFHVKGKALTGHGKKWKLQLSRNVLQNVVSLNVQVDNIYNDDKSDDDDEVLLMFLD
jgi:hypothetical protein